MGVMEGQEGLSSQCEDLRQDGPCQVGGRQPGGAGLLGPEEPQPGWKLRAGRALAGQG